VAIATAIIATSTLRRCSVAHATLKTRIPSLIHCGAVANTTWLAKYVIVCEKQKKPEMLQQNCVKVIT
jgi:hypothetical protein